jgi:hypothetical protein
VRNAYPIRFSPSPAKWISPAKREGTKANPLSERFSPGPRAFAMPTLSYWNTVPDSRSSGFATNARAPGL